MVKKIEIYFFIRIHLFYKLINLSILHMVLPSWILYIMLQKLDEKMKYIEGNIQGINEKLVNDFCSMEYPCLYSSLFPLTSVSSVAILQHELDCKKYILFKCKEEKEKITHQFECAQLKKKEIRKRKREYEERKRKNNKNS